MLTRTPSALTAQLQALAREIAANSRPVYIPVRPVAGGSPNECFSNVDSAIRLHGGSSVLGWALWEWPGVMIEAELHAVWKDKEGQLTDVSPRMDAETQVLFLPDPERVWDGHQVNNRRKPLRDDPVIREFIAVHDQIFTVMNAGDRAGEFGLVSVPRDEINPLMMRSAQLLLQLQKRLPGRNDPCVCGSGKKYKRCCASAV